MLYSIQLLTFALCTLNVHESMTDQNSEISTFHGNVQYQKISILPTQKGLEFPGGWVVLEDQKI